MEGIDDRQAFSAAQGGLDSITHLGGHEGRDGHGIPCQAKRLVSSQMVTGCHRWLCSAMIGGGDGIGMGLGVGRCLSNEISWHVLSGVAVCCGHMLST